MSIKVSKKETYTPAEMIVEWIEEDIIVTSDGGSEVENPGGGESDLDPFMESVTLE